MEKWKLNNGLYVFAYPYSGNCTCMIATIGSGVQNEPYSFNGIAHICEHLNVRQKIQSINAAQGYYGFYINAFTKRQYTAYMIKTSTENTGRALNIVGNFLLNYSKPFCNDPSLLSKEKENIVFENTNLEAKQQAVFLDAIKRKIFTSDSYGNSVFINPSKFRLLEYENINQYLGHSAHMPKSLIFIGNLHKLEDYISMLESINIQTENFGIKPLEFQINSLQHFKRNPGNFFIGIAYSKLNTMKEYIAINLLFRVIQSCIRDENITIDACNCHLYSNCSLITVNGFSKVPNNSILIEYFSSKLKQLCKGQELVNLFEMIKNLYSYQLLSSLDSSEYIAMYILKSVFFLKEYTDVKQLLKQVEQIDLQDIKNIVNKIVNGKISILSEGEK